MNKKAKVKEAKSGEVEKLLRSDLSEAQEIILYAACRRDQRGWGEDVSFRVIDLRVIPEY